METNKIYNESNLETMARMPDCFVDLTVTSPPYDDLRNYKGYSFPFEEIAKELYRVTKPGGVVVWVVGDATKNGSETLTSFRQALYFNAVGFNVHDTMIYEKGGQGATGSNKCYLQNFEYMFVLSKGTPKTINLIKDRKNVRQRIEKINAGKRSKDGEKAESKYRQGELYGYRFNVWKITNGGGASEDDIAFNHPAIFPEQLAADHVKTWSNEGDLVYDCFMGSGTVAKMAHLLNRKWIGSEISREYCEIADRRLKPYLQQLGLFPNGFEKAEGSVGKTKNYGSAA